MRSLVLSWDCHLLASISNAGVTLLIPSPLPISSIQHQLFGSSMACHFKAETRPRLPSTNERWSPSIVSRRWAG